MRPLRVGGPVTPPKLLHNPDPEYPEAARRVGCQGTVVLWLVVLPDGSPARIRVVRSVGMGMDEAAVSTVKTWRFQPSTRNRQPVAVMINVEVNFRLDGRSKISLYAPPEPREGQPRFPGVDVGQYPLVIHIGTATGVLAGKSYEIVASAAILGATDSVPLSISCSGKKNNCLFLSAGNYPARWLSPNHRLEILGEVPVANTWGKTEYSVK
jgi:protein TonB